MAGFTFERSIPRPPAEVWDYLTDFSLAPQWMRGTLKVSHLDTGEIGRGSRLLLDHGSRTRVYHVSYWEPKKRFTLHRRGRRHEGYFTWLLEGRDGSTRLLLKAELAFHGLWILASPFVHWYFRRLCRTRIDAVQARLSDA